MRGSNLFEIDSSQTILTKSNSAAVKAYLQEQVLGHQLALSILQNQQTARKDAGVAALATDQVPVVTQHLQEAQALLARTTAPAPPAFATP